jgi:hypothetical protein
MLYYLRFGLVFLMFLLDTAGTAVGTTYGIATQATIVAVKVCSDSGSCATSDIVSGVNYALAQFKANGKPSGKHTRSQNSHSALIDLR